MQKDIVEEIIFVNQVTGTLFADIVNDFAKRGEKVVLITGEITASGIISPDVEVIWGCKYNKRNFRERFISWFIFTIQVFFKVLFRFRKNRLFLVTTPAFLPFIGLIFKLFLGKKFDLLIYDIYPEALKSIGINERSMIFKVWGFGNKILFKRAENIFTLAKTMANLIETYGEDLNPIIIQNWVDINFVKPLAKNENKFAVEHNQLDKFTIMYSGNMGATHNIEAIVNLAFALKNDRRIEFLLIGDGDKRKMVEAEKECLRLSNLKLLPYQPFELLPLSISCADLFVVTLTLEATSASVPSKTFYALAAGVPILGIASEKTDFAKIIRKYSCGEVFTGDDIGKMKIFINKLLGEEKYLEKIKRNSRLASLNFTKSNSTKYYKYVKGIDENC